MHNCYIPPRTLKQNVSTRRFFMFIDHFDVNLPSNFLSTVESRQFEAYFHESYDLIELNCRLINFMNSFVADKTRRIMSVYLLISDKTRQL